MADIIEQVIKAGDLPPGLRGDLGAATTVLVSVRRLTENGFTEAFVAEALKSEHDAEGVPFRAANEIVAEPGTIADCATQHCPSTNHLGDAQN